MSILFIESPNTLSLVSGPNFVLVLVPIKDLPNLCSVLGKLALLSAYSLCLLVIDTDRLRCHVAGLLLASVVSKLLTY